MLSGETDLYLINAGFY